MDLQKQTVAERRNDIFEAYTLLRSVASDVDMKAEQEEIQRSYPNLDWKKAELLISVTQNIEAEAKKIFKNRDEVTFYFVGNAGGEGCIANLLLLWKECPEVEYESVDALFADMAALTQEEYFKRFGKRLLNYGARIGDDEEREWKDAMEICRFIAQMELPEEEKWRIQQVFINPEKYRIQLETLLKEAIDILHRYDKELTAVADEFAAYWKEFLKKEEFLPQLKKALGVDMEENPNGLIIFPDIFACHTVSLSAETTKTGGFSSPYYIRIGVLIGELLPLDGELQSFGSAGMSEEARAEKAVIVLKLLSDKSKFEILTSIKTERAYGSELAKRFHLTTATISHHMAALLDAGLIEVQKVDGRVYYRSRTETIQETLEYCRKVLTEE